MAEDRKERAGQSLATVVIEIANDRNRCHIWPITKQHLRGRWLRANVAGEVMQLGLAMMPDTPGMRIMVDPQRAQATISDPLADPDNELKFAKVEQVYEEAFRTKVGPHRTTVHSLRDEGEPTGTQLKTWLYWMRRAVNAGYAIVHQGELPSLAQIEALPGKTKTECYNSSARARRFREDPEMAA